MKNERIIGLDILRSLAIILVLFSHTSFLIPSTPQTREIIFLASGYFGVEFFFVLSGFLIGRILFSMFHLNNSFGSTRLFWTRRWFRTLPNYFFALMLNTFLFIRSGSFDVSTTDYLAYLFFLQNFFTPHLPFFIESWSLTIEEWSYLLLPFLFLLSRRGLSGLNDKKVVVILVFLLCFFTILRTSVFVANPNADWNYQLRMVVIYRVDSICLGVLFAWLFEKRFHLWTKYKGLALLVGSFILLGNLFVLIKYISGGRGVVKLYLFTFFLIVTSLGVGLLLPWLSLWKKNSNVLFHGVFTYVSKVSYSVYLFHIVIINFTITLLSRFPRPYNVWYCKIFLSWVLTLAISGIVYKYFEMPIMKIRERFG